MNPYRDYAEMLAVAANYMDCSPRDVVHRISRRMAKARKIIRLNYGYVPEPDMDTYQLIRMANIAGWRCAYCNVKTWFYNDNDPHFNTFTIDHINPLYGGGTNSPNNIVCACYGCNTRKERMALDEWLNEMQIDVGKFEEKVHNILKAYEAGN